MSAIGYHRYKVDNLTAGEYSYPFYKNGNLLVTHTVIVKAQECTEDKFIKYLDRNGQYRFFPFNSYFEKRDKPNLLGKANKVITSILDSQTNQQNVGYKNERTITLTTDAVSQDELEILSDVFTSPRVYLHIGEGNADEEKDWLEVTISGDGIVRRKKMEYGKFQIDVILPEWFSISML